ncbi:basic leucine zipper 4-like [Gossypium arboreum]|nr:basic leucine zipper 4-like [Gossypium arboreum]
MLSTVPAIISSNPMMESDPFPSLQSAWDCSQLFSTTQSVGPARSGSASTELNQTQTQTQTHSNSGLDESNKTLSIIDERKRRRMISNRESARRSRMRKQKHLENLRNQANRLRIENRELTYRLRFLLYHCHRVRTDNDRLRSESTLLRQKLSDMHQNLLFKQLQQFSSAWPCNNVTVMSEQIPPPLII